MSSETELTNAIISMVIEAWRFKGNYERLLTGLKPAEQKRYLNQFNWYFKKAAEGLESAGLRVAEFPVGMAFDPGLKISAVNLEDFQPGDPLVIKQILEPTILASDDRIDHVGSVILEKAAK